MICYVCGAPCSGADQCMSCGRVVCDRHACPCGAVLPVIKLSAAEWKELQDRCAEAMRSVVQEHMELAHTGRGFFIHDEFIQTYVPEGGGCMRLQPLEHDPLPCHVCGTDRCELCHTCTVEAGEAVLVEDCICEEERHAEAEAEAEA